MERLSELDKDYYCDDLSDGVVASDSSDDEDQADPLAGFPVLRELRQQAGEEPQKSEADDFEAEMNQSLSMSFEAHEQKLLACLKPISSSSKHVTFNPSMDKLDFPSNSKDQAVEMDEEGLECKATGSDDEFYESTGPEMKEFGQTNDDLLYDPEMDKNDQQWVDEQRQLYQKSAKLAKSDAILNCPACMTTLCFDCQRHALYKTQYRAMFVMNCQICEDEVLFVPHGENRAGKKKNKKSINGNDTAVSNNDQEDEHSFKSGQRHMVDAASIDLLAKCQKQDLFKPVKCSKCNTEVAVIDSDEVYHFFNVLSSYV